MEPFVIWPHAFFQRENRGVQDGRHWKKIKKEQETELTRLEEDKMYREMSGEKGKGKETQ